MKNKGSIALLKAIVNKELKKNIDIEKLEKNLEKAYNTIPHRLAKAIKLYFGMEKNSKGNYCKSYKEVGEEMDNLLTNKKGVNQERARQLVHLGLRHLRHTNYGGNYIKTYKYTKLNKA